MQDAKKIKKKLNRLFKVYQKPFATIRYLSEPCELFFGKRSRPSVICISRTIYDEYVKKGMI